MLASLTTASLGGWKPSTNRVIAMAKTPSLKASNLPFDIQTPLSTRPELERTYRTSQEYLAANTYEFSRRPFEARFADAPLRLLSQRKGVK
jgi:hypothetical protein